VTSEITQIHRPYGGESASEITIPVTPVAPAAVQTEASTDDGRRRRGARRGARPTELSPDLAEFLESYAAELDDAPLSAETRRTYVSRVRMYLAWLVDRGQGASAGSSRGKGDPLTSARARDWAVRDYRRWLLKDGPVKRSVVYVNSTLTAIDDFYLRLGLGKANVERDALPATAPRALDERARIRWLRAVEAHSSHSAGRDRLIALLPYYAGARISEIVRLDVADVHRSARKAKVVIYGKGNKVREVAIHPRLRPCVDAWLEERGSWPGAVENPALFLNAKGGRLSVRAASGIIAAIAEAAGLPESDQVTAHVQRHTFATSLVRGNTDLVVVAELLGHSRLETTRRYSLPSDDDKAHALDLLTVDR
jgi:site-specific recombinase XerD